MGCLFCSFADRSLPAEILSENDLAYALLDIHPSAPGHTLVIPKFHVATLLELPERFFLPMLSLAQSLLPVLTKTVRADGFTMGINHGSAGHQGILHLHFHIIPRFLNDNGGSLHTVVQKASQMPLSDLAAVIRAHLAV